MKDKTFYKIMNLLGIILIFIVSYLSYSLGLANGEVVRFEVDNDILNASMNFNGVDSLIYDGTYYFNRNGQRCNALSQQFQIYYGREK